MANAEQGPDSIVLRYLRDIDRKVDRLGERIDSLTAGERRRSGVNDVLQRWAGRKRLWDIVRVNYRRMGLRFRLVWHDRICCFRVGVRHAHKIPHRPTRTDGQAVGKVVDSTNQAKIMKISRKGRSKVVA
jgi:hypothetical protein